LLRVTLLIHSVIGLVGVVISGGAHTGTASVPVVLTSTGSAERRTGLDLQEKASTSRRVNTCGGELPAANRVFLGFRRCVCSVWKKKTCKGHGDRHHPRVIVAAARVST
jgi:hypothetical protein